METSSSVTVTVPADDPIVAAVEDRSTAKIEITRGRLLAALKSVRPFMCQDFTRFHLASILIETNAGHLRMVATDGHTLARADVPFLPETRNAGAVDDGRVLLSADDAKKLIGALKHTKKESDRPVTLTIKGRSIVASIDGADLTFRGVDAQYPPYGQVIPKVSTTGKRAARVGFNPTYLARACDAIADFGRDAHSGIGAVIQHGESDLDPMLVTFNGGALAGDFLAVIMPMRL